LPGEHSEAIRRPDDVSAWEEVRQTALRIGHYDTAEEATETIRELSHPENLLASDKHG
jgi:hypothetical protein